MDSRTRKSVRIKKYCVAAYNILHAAESFSFMRYSWVDFNFYFESLALICEFLWRGVSYFETLWSLRLLFLRDKTEIPFGITPAAAGKSSNKKHERRSTKEGLLRCCVDSQSRIPDFGRAHCRSGSNFEQQASRFRSLFKYLTYIPGIVEKYSNIIFLFVQYLDLFNQDS